MRLSIANYGCTGYSGFDDVNYDNVFSAVVGRNINDISDSLIIRNLSGSVEDCNAVLKIFDDAENGFIKRNLNFHEAKDLAAFVMNRSRCNARFYINEHDRTTLILFDGLTVPTYHLIQSLTPRLFPWFFTELPLDEVEMSLLDSLTRTTAADYEYILVQLADRFDFREFVIKQIVGNFEKSGRIEEIENTKHEIENYRSSIRDLERRYQDYIQRIDNLNMTLNGQEMALQSASDCSELVDYFVCNRNLDPTYVDGRRLSFTVKTFLEVFDPEQYRTYIGKTNSFLYTGYEYPNQFESIAVRRKFMDAIFSDDPVLRVKVCANYRIDLRGIADAVQWYEYGAEFNDYVPNPHIQHYACLGNYRSYIQRMLQEGNVIGAIEQCIASAKSLNFAEAHTVRYFLTDVFNSKTNIIRLPDGSDVTPIEALEYINGMDAKKEEKNV